MKTKTKRAEMVRQLKDMAAKGRGLTPDELDRTVDLISKSVETDERIAAATTYGTGNAGANAGRLFTQSPEYKAAVSDVRAQVFNTGLVELQAKGTLTEASGSGQALVPPEYLSGIASTPFAPLQSEALFAASSIGSREVRYPIEGTATSAAAGVAEGGVKPESTLALSEVVEPVKKIANVVSVSDELFEDASSLESYINERLSLFVQTEVERQLLRGTAGGNEVVGVFNRSGVATFGRGTISNADAILTAAANTRGSANIEPDSVILHPTNYLSTRLSKDTAGQYLGGGPFGGSYGNASQNAPAVGFSAGNLWGLRVALSTVVGPGTALVGSFQQAAHIYNRGGVRVEASNSHSDYFVRDLVSLRSERRLALAVFRPNAFVQVTGLN